MQINMIIGLSEHENPKNSLSRDRFRRSRRSFAS